MPSRFDPSEGFSIFDDKGEAKGLVEKAVRDRDPDVTIERMRKLDFLTFSRWLKDGITGS